MNKYFDPDMRDTPEQRRANIEKARPFSKTARESDPKNVSGVKLLRLEEKVLTEARVFCKRASNTPSGRGK